MSYRIFCEGELIGEADLELGDEGMNVLSGQFRPAPGYEAVRAIFRLFVDATPERLGPANKNLLRAYYQQRDALALTVVAPNGEQLLDRVVHVNDFRDECGEGDMFIELFPI